MSHKGDGKPPSKNTVYPDESDGRYLHGDAASFESSFDDPPAGAPLTSDTRLRAAGSSTGGAEETKRK